MLTNVKNLTLTLLGGLLIAQSTLAQPAQPAPAAPKEAPAAAPRPTVPLHVIDKSVFCSRLEQAFANYGTANGLDRVHTALLASGATTEVVQEFRTGRASDYMRLAAVRAFARIPDPAPQEESYLPLAGVIGQAMGIGNNISLALSTGELRFIPGAQKGMDIVVIAQNAATLSPQRAQKVIEVANASQIHISIVWVGDQDNGQAVEDARSLAWIAANTGGAFTNLGGGDNPCATPGL